MDKYTVNIVLEGNAFYPSRLMGIGLYKLKVLAEPGVIAKRGKYRGQPSPYGLATLTIEAEAVVFFAKFKALLESLVSDRLILKEQGVELITFDFTPFPPETVLLVKNNYWFPAYTYVLKDLGIPIESNFDDLQATYVGSKSIELQSVKLIKSLGKSAFNMLERSLAEEPSPLGKQRKPDEIEVLSKIFSIMAGEDLNDLPLPPNQVINLLYNYLVYYKEERQFSMPSFRSFVLEHTEENVYH